MFNDKEQKVCIFTYNKEKGTKATFLDAETQRVTSVKEAVGGNDIETQYTYFPDSDKIETEKILVDGVLSEQRLPDGSSVGWYADGSKKFEQQANGSRKEWHLNGKLSAEILCSDDKRKISEARYDETGKRTHFEHYDKDGKDDTRLYLAKQKVAQNNVDKGAAKGKIQKKLNPLVKAIKMHKALKEVDSGK